MHIIKKHMKLLHQNRHQVLVLFMNFLKIHTHVYSRTCIYIHTYIQIEGNEIFSLGPPYKNK